MRKTLEKGKLANGVDLCWIGWEDFLEAIKGDAEVKNDPEDKFTHLILRDLEALLIKKGFEKFISFESLEKMPPVCENSYYKFGDRDVA